VGMIHSVRFDGALYLPWRQAGNWHWQLAAGYLALAALALLWGWLADKKGSDEAA